jgi:lipopolysaccharide transport system ATP-binding protein
MSDIAISVKGISKRYYISGKREANTTLREMLTDSFASPFRRVGRLLRGQARGAADSDEAFWALRDVSFEVRRGEIVGLIGRNGAGKSTLLKILSRITEPTEGYADLHGRVGSLLEVGTGFHAELTGRENIYLNGSILGMKTAEIARKFDEIVAFAEVERFIDTPVKRYSSGMYLRLAFAVAAFLDPEILLIDEVLAVGDARFQKKCINKMQDVGQHGRTVLFVSHNMPAITRLCERVILLDEGKMLQDGPSYQVIRTYLDSGLGTSAAREWSDLSKAPGNDIVRLRAVRVRTEDGVITEAVDIRRPFGIDIEYQVLKSGNVLVPSFRFFNEDGIHLFTTFDLDPAWRLRPRSEGRYVSTAWIPGNLLAEGTILVGALVNSFNPPIVHVNEPDAVAFHVIDSLDGDAARGDFAGHMRGVMRPLLQWTTQGSMHGPGTPYTVTSARQLYESNDGSGQRNTYR